MERLRRFLYLAPIVGFVAACNTPQEATCTFYQPPNWSPAHVRVDVPKAKAGEDMWGTAPVQDHQVKDVLNKKTIQLIINVGPLGSTRGEAYVEIYRSGNTDGCAVRKVSIAGKHIQGDEDYAKHKVSASAQEVGYRAPDRMQ